MSVDRSTAIPVRPGADSGAVRLGVEDQALLALAETLRDFGYRFTTISPASHARVNQRPGNRWAAGMADVFGWSRPFHEQLLPPAMLALMRTAAVLEPATSTMPRGNTSAAWRSGVRFSTLRCGRREQLLIHSAYPTDAGDAVFFGPDTYRFIRALEATLGEQRLVDRALDLGCGTAAAAISIAQRFGDAEVIASDINASALRLGRINAILADTARIRFVHSDLFADIDGDFDLIVANPPFMQDPLERGYRHGGGRRGEGLSLRLLKAALSRLRPGGLLLLYTGSVIVDGSDEFLAQVQRLLPSRQWQWSYEEVDPDIFGEELAVDPRTGANHAYAAADRIAAVLLKVSRGDSIAPQSPAC